MHQVNCYFVISNFKFTTFDLQSFRLFYFINRKVFFWLLTPKIVGSFYPPWMNKELLLPNSPSRLLCSFVHGDNMCHWGIHFCWACGTQLLCHLPKVVTLSRKFSWENPGENKFTALQNFLSNSFQHLAWCINYINSDQWQVWNYINTIKTLNK